MGQETEAQTGAETQSTIRVNSKQNAPKNPSEILIEKENGSTEHCIYVWIRREGSAKMTRNQ